MLRKIVSENVLIILFDFTFSNFLCLFMTWNFNPKAYAPCILFGARQHVKKTNRISNILQSWMPQVFNKTYINNLGWVGLASLYHDQPLDGKIWHEMEAADEVESLT